MKWTTLPIFLAVGLTLGACAPTAQNPDVTSSQGTTAVDRFVGKRLVASEAVFLYKDDGTIGGTLRGERVVGTYTADARELCSTYSEPEILRNREFCSTPAFDGNEVVFTRRDGSQSVLYRIEG